MRDAASGTCGCLQPPLQHTPPTPCPTAQQGWQHLSPWTPNKTPCFLLCLPLRSFFCIPQAQGGHLLSPPPTSAWFIRGQGIVFCPPWGDYRAGGGTRPAASGTEDSLPRMPGDLGGKQMISCDCNWDNTGLVWAQPEGFQLSPGDAIHG